jgi:DNA polymerase-3 subunit beta
MEFKLRRNELLDAIRTVLSIVPSNPTHPILGTVLFKFSSAVVELTGFDLKTLINAKVDYKTIDDSRPADFCLGMPTAFCKLLESLNDDFVKLTINEEIITLSVTNGSYDFPKSALDNYPDTAMDIRGDALFHVELGNTFADSFRIISKTISTDPTKQVLCGFNLKYDKERSIKLAGTNGHKLSWSKIKPPKVWVDGKYIVDEDLVEELEDDETNESDSSTNQTLSIDALKSAIPLGDVFQLYIHEGIYNLDVFTQVGEELHQLPYSFAGRMLDGAYPYYEQLIPQTFAHTLTCDLNDLIQSLERLMIFNQKDSFFIIEFDRSASNSQITINSTNEVSNASTQINIESGFSEHVNEFKIGLNLKYALESIKAFKGLGTRRLKIHFSEHGTQPIVLEPIGSLFEIKTLVMPVKIRS